MKIYETNYSDYWFAKVELSEQEWPPTDWHHDDSWLDRPIRIWVKENMSFDYFFAYYGHILFHNQKDLIAFKIRWYNQDTH